MPKNIADFSKEELKDFIDSIDVVLTDCDGELLRYLNVFKIVKILNFKNSLNFINEKKLKKSFEIYFKKCPRSLVFNSHNTFIFLLL